MYCFLVECTKHYVVLCFARQLCSSYSASFPKSSIFDLLRLVSFLNLKVFGKEMGFIMEFAENLVLRLMEDPEERDRKAREHIYEMHERCKKIKEMWALPIRPYGFWTFERHNAQLRWDPQISQVAGRRDPYDDLLKDTYTPGSSSSSN